MENKGPLFFLKPEKKNACFSANLLKMCFSQFSLLSPIPFHLGLLTLQISFVCVCVCVLAI